MPRIFCKAVLGSVIILLGAMLLLIKRGHYKVADRQMSFVKDKHGKTVQLILHQFGTDQVAEKID